MKCPFCSKADCKVLESRQSEDAFRRRRECNKCRKRFTTYERVEATNIWVVKRDGRREQFSREKLKSGILRSCQKRAVSIAQIENTLDYIENQLKKRRSGEVPSKVIGEIVMKRLKRLDKIAYIRFASVYLDFKDPIDFESAVEEVAKKRK